MDVSKLFNEGGWIIPNPNYDKKKKKQTEPPFIKTTNSELMQPYIAKSAFGGAANTKVGGDISKLIEYGVTPYDDIDINAILADKQSNLTKLGNALAQTVVSEICLGTLKGVSDLFDMTIGQAFNSDGDYSNAVSKKLGELQEAFNNDVAPIYTKPGLSIDNGGLTDFGWWASNIPSIASSLTLLIPSTGITRGLSALGKASGLFKGIGNIRKAATGLSKLEKAVKVAEKAGDANKLMRAERALKNMEGLSDIAKWANRGSIVKNTNRFFEYGVNAIASRAMENYQEASQVYSDLLPEITNEINKLSPKDYNELIERNKDILKDVDINDRGEVAKKIAHEGAARTFTDDWLNVGFDIVELYGLRNLKGFMNGPMRASVRRAHLNDLKTMNLDAEEAKNFLANRSFFKKAGEKVSDMLYGSRVAIGAQLSEGAEEAINYIAQEEGMRYGHVLLSGKKDVTTFGNRLKGYLAAPGLHDSAFWGVLGGVVFQAGGSKLRRIENAYDARKYKNKTDFKNAEQTGEQRAETQWFKDFELPEITSRKNNINRRRGLIEALKDELDQINNGKNPWATDPETKQNLDIEGGRDGEIASILRDKAYNKFAQSIMMDAMFSGNWNLAKEYLASDEVKKYLVDKGMISEEEANKRQREIDVLAKKLEKSYDNNMRVIENALHGIHSKTGANLDEVPFEFYQLVAADNMRYELDADQAQRNIDNWQPTIGSEEERLHKELTEQGVNYKKAIKAFILAKELGEVQAALDDAKRTKEEGRVDTEDSIDPRTLEGQAAIKELELRKKVLTNMLSDYIEGDNIISQQARQLSIIRAAAGTIKENGRFTYSRDSEKFKAIDAAILKADDISRKLNKDKDKTTPDEWRSLMSSIFGEDTDISKEDWDSISYQANIFDEMIGHALGADGMMKSLDNLSNKLLNAYVGVVQNEIVKQIALEHIAVGRDQVLEQVHFKHNVMVESRNSAIYLANNILKNLAKNKFDEHGDISDLLAYGAMDKEYRAKLKEILTPRELAQYDDAMQVLAISKVNGAKIAGTNALLPDVIKDTIYWSARDKFEDVLEITGDEDERKDGEKSSEPKDAKLDTKETAPSSPPPSVPKSSEEPAKSVEFDFSTDKNGNKLPQKQASLTMTDDGTITGLTQKTDGSEDVTANLIPVEEIHEDGTSSESEDTFDLDFGNDLKKDVFNSSQLFNGTEKRLDDNAVVLSLPRVILNSDGTIKEIHKGEIGIGEPASPEKSSKETESPEADTEFNQDEFNVEVTSATIPEMKRLREAGQTVTEGSIVEALTNMFSDKATPEQIKIALDYGKTKRTKLVNRLNSNAEETSSVIDAVSSAIEDSKHIVTKGKLTLDSAFDKLLNNYIKRAYIRNTSYGKVISLENLLRYCNEITDDPDVARVLYKYCIRQLHARSSDNPKTNIIILEEINSRKLNNNSINNDIVNASKLYDKLIPDSANSGRTVDFNWILSNIGNDEEQKQEYYDYLYNLKAGEKLSYVVDVSGKYITLFKNHKRIGTLKAPEETENNYILEHKGWIVDIPKQSEGIKGSLEQLFIDCMVNPTNNSKFEKVKDALYEAVYASKVELPEALNNIIDTLVNAVGEEELSKYFTEEKGKDINRDRAKYILDIFKGFKIVSDSWLSSRQMEAKDLYSALSNEITDSIHNWFSKLYDSSTAISILKSSDKAGKPVSISVGTNNVGAVRTLNDDKKQPINAPGVIGTDHKGQVYIGIVPFNGSAIHLPTGELINHYGGDAYTFIAIRKPDGSYGTAKAFPNNLNASHYSSKVAQIRKDIHKEFKKRFRTWFANRKHSVTTDDLYDFFNKLCHSRNGNVPLCQGLSVHRMTNGKTGITLEWTVQEMVNDELIPVTKRVRFYDRNKNNTVNISNVQLPSDKFGKEHGYYDDSGKWIDRTNEVAKEILKILDDNLKFNVAEAYVNNSPVNTGYARKTTDGTFIIQIPGGEEIVFDSYNDFIMNEGIVSVATVPDKNGRRNFYNPNESKRKQDNPNLTFDINEKPDSKEISSEPKKEVPVSIENNIADKIKNDIINNSSDSKLADRILKELLEKSVLRKLKSSTLLKALQIKNIKFVKEFRGDFCACARTSGVVDGVQINAGDIIVTQRWLDLIQENTKEDREQAFRHFIHEAIHKKIGDLSKEQKDRLFKEVRNIFNDFVDANDKENRNDYVKKYEYNTTEEDIKRYYNPDGTINDEGLEEFLVESVTRPELMKRLNEIAVDDNGVQKEKVDIKKPKTLLQRIIASIINAFGSAFKLKMNQGSLLEKEYKLFEDLILDFDNQIEKEANVAKDVKVVNEIKPGTQLTIPFDFDDNTKQIDARNPIDRNNAPVDDIVSKVSESITNSSNNTNDITSEEATDFADAFDSKIEDSDISDINDARQNVNPENRNAFNSLVDNGAINVKC